MIFGKKSWIFPDGELPPAGEFPVKGHESVILLNLGDAPAEITMDLYFEERPPQRGIRLFVPAERVRCVRMDNAADLGGYQLERELQYAIVLRSDRPIVAQYGRLDTRQQPMAFYTTPGYSQEG